MEIKGKHLLIILALSMITKTESSMELKSYTACYGILGLQNFLQPSCPAGQKMAVVAVYTLAKYKSTGCPQQQTHPSDDPECCQYDVTDCSYLYDSGSFRSYYQTCNGKSSCLIQISWIDIPSHCNSSVYIERTHYMKMDYYCISDQAVDPCMDLTTSDSPTFFWNSGYPAEMTSTSTSCTCSIEMSCDTTVQLTANDLQLKDPGICKQSLVITDGGSSNTYDCSSNNDFLPRVIYISTGHFLTIVFTNNLGTTGGKFFIQIQGTNPTGEVTLSCGTSALTMSSQSPSSLPTCPVEGDTTTNLPTTGSGTSTDDSTTLTAMSTGDSTTLTALTTNSLNLSSTTEDDLSTMSSDTSTTSVVNTTLLLSTDITSDVTEELTTMASMSTENISMTPDKDSCCNDSNASDELPVYVIPLIVLGVLLILTVLLLYYKDQIMARCKGKRKGENEDTEDIEDNNIETNPIFEINLGEHSGFQSLPPLRHEYTMSGRNLDTPTPITRDHERFQKAQNRYDKKTPVKFSEEMLDADSAPIAEMLTPNDKHVKEGKKQKRKKNKAKKRHEKNKVFHLDDIQHNEGVTSEL